MNEKKYNISKMQLVECLSTALELVNPAVAGHNKRVAVLSRELAKIMCLSEHEVQEIYYAALLHDIGATPLSIKEKNDIIEFDVNKPYKHCLLGYMLLSNYKPFEKIADIVHYHHEHWLKGQNRTNTGELIPIGSFIIHLADRVDILIRQDQHILTQKKRIVDHIKLRQNSVFAPEAVAALDILNDNEAFWLSSTNDPNCLMRMSGCRKNDEYISQEELEDFTELISLVIDFKSRFTASHSCGVSTTVGLLAEISGMTGIEQKELQIAGNLHDIGKLIVPNEILEKNGRLDDDEDAYIKSHSYYTYSILSQIPDLQTIATHAAQHHEKIDGSGYPFHIGGEEISLNSKLLAAADIFTALTEDRPYRQGLEKDDVLSIMNKMSDERHLETDIVKSVKDYYGDIDQLRIEAQNDALVKYKDFWKTTNKMLASYQ
jgi:HD-GYP domain-containing protein (c-di-GMP phosphodiesterase class II)